MNEFTSGQGVEFRVTFTSPDAVGGGNPTGLVDPTTVAFRLRPPSGIDVDLTLAGGGVVRESLGVFYARQTLAQVGVWEYHWVGTGTLDAVVAGWVRVVADPVAV
jgi:hypothetical protein